MTAPAGSPSWPAVRAAAEAVLALPAAARPACLDRVCGADAALRAAVIAQVDACERAAREATFLAAPAAAFAAPFAAPFAAAFLADPPSDVLAALRDALAGRYAVERELGRGGTATVYLARDLRHDRHVALKVLDPALGASLSAERFLREIRVTAGLTHPHVLPLHDSGDAAGLLYYVMPYVEGESLRERLARGGPMPSGDVLRLGREVASALAHAHRHGVVHRDVKPANILLADGHAVVADFGIARAVDQARGAHGADGGDAPLVDGRVGGVTLTDAGTSPGTPAYMAPEQVRGDAAVDHRADLYALGLVLYEASAGAHPFAGRPARALAAAHLGETPPPLSTRRGDVAPALAALVTRLLAKDPAARPASAADVLRALDAVPNDRDGAADVSDIPTRGVRRWPIALAGAASLALATLAAFAARPGWSHRPLAGAPSAAPSIAVAAADSAAARRLLVAPFENLTGDPTLAPVGRMAAEWLAQGLAGTGLVDVTIGGTPGAASDERVLRAAAAANGAGLAVVGSYYVEGDSVRVQARVLDVRHGRLLAPVEAVRAPRDAPQQVLDPLRRRVTTVVAIARNRPTFANFLGDPVGVAPDYEAYRRFAAGSERFDHGDLAGALRDWARAAARDTSFVSPLVISVQALLMLHEDARADSLLRRLAPRRAALAPFERGILDRLRAVLAGDREGALAAARTIRQAAPGWHLGYFLEAQDALHAGRPREALEAATHLAADSAVVRDPRAGEAYWRTVADAHHQLGEYAAEWAIARAERAALPNSPEGLAHELRALGASGRLAELPSRLDALEATPSPRAPHVATLLADVADELEAHGQAVLAQRVRARVVRLTGDRTGGPWRDDERAARGRALVALGRLGEADAVFAALARTHPGDATYVAALAIDAARRGRRTEAERVAARLARTRGPYDRGRTTYLRARLAAAAGDLDGALSLLRQAIEEGLGYGPSLHADPAFATLRADARFAALLRPTG